MDWILLAIVVFYFIVGAYKGFVSTLFSFVGTFVAVVASYKLCGYLAESLKNLSMFDGIENGLNNILNSEVEGTFENMQQLTLALFNTKYGKIFGILIKFLAGNVVFDGEMTAGQILAPILTFLLCKIIAFIVIFIGISIVVALVRIICNACIKIFHLKMKNHIAGGFVGVVKGLFIFGVIYTILVGISNFLFSESLLAFVRSGPISNKLYDLLVTKIIGLFY